MHFADYLFAKSNLEKEGEKFFLFFIFFSVWGLPK